MKIFVAGATGVIGRRVVPLLVEGAGRSRPSRAVRMHGAVCNLATGIPSSNRAMLPFA
jgi:uncharacterized protein YbjT (DUF2867 family)